jgi:tRNA(Ser,Leu) C12 N-acetylase TAN1
MAFLKKFSITTVFMLMIMTAVNAQIPAPASLYTQSSEMANLMIQFEADKGSLSRFYATSPINSWWWQESEDAVHSPELRQRLLDLIGDYLKETAKLDFASMQINGKVDYIMFKSKLEDERYQLLKEQKLYSEVEKYMPFYAKINAIERPRRRGIAPDAAAVAKDLNTINADITKAIESAKKMDSIDMEQALMVSNSTKGMQGALKNYFNFYNGYDPMFTWWVPRTYADTDSLLKVYAETMKKKGRITTSQKDDGSGIIGKPIGREELIRQLKLEFIPYTPEELVEIANKEFAWCDAELLKASREMGFGDDWKKAQEKVKQTYVAPGKQPEAMYDLYKQSVDFLKANDLLTVPPLAEETWRMYMMSPERQRVNPFFLGGESLIISYPTNTMTYDEKMMSMRGNNPNFSRATVHHELIAGHHLQGYMSNRFKPYRHFDTPFWVEGNALYWELLLWDMKFPQTPEQRIGMLFWRMHRCARIIFSLNYQLGKWRPQQCIDFLVDRVGHERANAEGEVRRSFTGGYSPLYQIAYMMGGLQFMALKKELVDTKKMSYKQFHDAILRENSIPIEMLRAILTNQSLQKDFTTSWRFYGK